MKFYKIDNQGLFQVPRVSTLPTYNDDVHAGSLYYQESNNNFYLGISGVNGGWGEVIVDISAVTDRIDIIENNITIIEEAIAGESISFSPDLKKVNVL